MKEWLQDSNSKIANQINVNEALEDESWVKAIQEKLD